MKISSLVAFVIVAGLGPAQAQDWSVPENLGPGINSAFSEDLPHISKDGLSLFFISNRHAGPTDFDIWVSQRAKGDDAWGAPVRLGPEINTAFNERGPCLSRDRHYLFFSSDRPGGFGNQDLYVSYRKNAHDDFGWETPVNLGPGLNTSDPDFGPAYLENDDVGVPTLHFARREGGGDADILVSRFQPDGSLEPGVVVTELSTESDDLRPTIRANGLELCFNSNRPGSAINDLWFSTRGSIFEPWSEPVNAGPIVNSASNEQFPALSADGTTLIFSSNRPGGFGSNDLYSSTRPKRDLFLTDQGVALGAPPLAPPSMGLELVSCRLSSPDVVAVRYSTANDGPLSIDVLDLQGRRLGHGELTASTTGRGDATVTLTRAAAPGLAIVRARQGTREAVRKLVMIR